MAKPLYAEIPWGGPTTAASVAAAPGPNVGLSSSPVWIYVDEFNATYKWTPASLTAVDNFRVLGHTGGGAGRWILDGDRIFLQPIGGGADDWARLALAWAAMAYHGTIVLAPGAWSCQTTQTLVSGVAIEAGPGVAITTSLAKLIVPPFNALFYNVQATGAPVTTTVNANAAPGATTITVASSGALAVGNLIYIQNGLVCRCVRKIENIAGVVVTLDRPLLRPFVVGNTVQVIDGANGIRDVRINGNGATVTGTAACVAILLAAYNCVIEGFNVSADMFAPFCYDNGTRDSYFRDCKVDGLTTSQQAYLLASCENCAIEDCDSTRTLSTLIYMAGNDNCRIDGGMHSISAGDGLTMTVDDVADTLGNRGCVIANTTFLKAGGSGVFVKNGSSENTFANVESSFNTSGGYLINSGASRNVIVAGRCRSNGQVAIAIGAGPVALGNKAIGLAVSGNDIGVFQASGGSDFEATDCTVDDTSATVATVGMLQALGAGTVVRVNGGRWATSRNAQHGIQVDTTAKVYVDGGWEFVGTGANNAAVIVNIGVAKVGSMKAISGFGFFMNGAAATTFARVGDSCDVSQTTTPFGVGLGGVFNRGRIGLTAAAALAIAFADTNAQDQFKWSYETNVGATGVVITGAPVAGTGFNIVGLAGDTSIINYQIGTS